ncbi:Rv3235 family protein [Pseudarthrobacter sp. NPDC092439]|uniref:Rv3235 family protein n=1 Tax=unclassified Pseudarthrobacter TaxID=2647000 RepID=UPI0037F619E9
MTAATPIQTAQELRKEPRQHPGAGPHRQTGTPRDDSSDIRAITRGTVQAAMEVLAGIRPVHQLARRLDPRCLATLQHRAALIRREATRTANPVLARLHRNSSVGSVRVCEVSEGIYEASAVVVDDVRARAVAVRLERSKQVWRVTELVIG